jgi:iron complex transport system ATP-binding protein
MNVEVCILAGGQSRRMGKPKPAMMLDGLPLVEWSKRIARGAGLPYRVIDRDLGESRGPISGIQTALKTTRADAVIFLSCDMPFVRSATLRNLTRYVVPPLGGRAVMGVRPPNRLKPELHTSTAFSATNGVVGFPFILRRGEIPDVDSLQSLAQKTKAKRLEISDEESFNINTPADFVKAEHLLAAFRNRTILDVDSLSVRRGEVEILRDINWRVLKGEHWAILGANGSGKTSLLSALTGYLSPTTGRFRVLGQEFGRSDWRELRKHIGLVSSAVRQLMADSETALETVASGKDAVIDVWGPLKRGDRERARAILARIGCSHLEKRVWAVLSQGERQRVLIGRALMANPQVLILDEPCAGLDPAAREHFLEFLQALTEKRNGPAIVLVTHHVEEIVTGITHVLALKDGEIAAAGTKTHTLTSTLLSKIFQCRARLIRERGRFRLHASATHRGVM